MNFWMLECLMLEEIIIHELFSDQKSVGLYIYIYGRECTNIYIYIYRSE